MINWLNLLFNTIWILGGALALAALSIAYCQSRQGGKKLGVILKGTKFALPMNIAGGLFALGMGLTADRWWEIALWLILMGMFGVRIYELKIEN